MHSVENWPEEPTKIRHKISTRTSDSSSTRTSDWRFLSSTDIWNAQFSSHEMSRMVTFKSARRVKSSTFFQEGEWLRRGTGYPNCDRPVGWKRFRFAYSNHLGIPLCLQFLFAVLLRNTEQLCAKLVLYQVRVSGHWRDLRVRSFIVNLKYADWMRASTHYKTPHVIKFPPSSLNFFLLHR